MSGTCEDLELLPTHHLLSLPAVMRSITSGGLPDASLCGHSKCARSFRSAQSALIAYAGQEGD